MGRIRAVSDGEPTVCAGAPVRSGDLVVTNEVIDRARMIEDAGSAGRRPSYEAIGLPFDDTVRLRSVTEDLRAERWKDGSRMASGAASAALRVASRFGYPADDPLVVSETNNTLVWLSPHAVIAKVGTQPHSADTLAREHAVAIALPSDAPIARPVPGVAPSIDERSGAIVTLWERIESNPRGIADPRAIGESLLELHRALATYRGDLPSFLIGVGRAWEVLADDGAMEALPEDDRSFLATAFGRLVDELDRQQGYVEQPLHGEPHRGNLLISGAGPRWIDLENVCTGPLEWDLAFLPDGAVEVFPRVDEELLHLLRLLSSACVATWCWSRPWQPELRRHAELHLARLRDAEA